MARDGADRSPVSVGEPLPLPAKSFFRNLDKILAEDTPRAISSPTTVRFSLAPADLKDWPVVLTRYPDGIAGSPFQKDAPFAPEAPHRADVERGEARHRRFVPTTKSLLYLANLGRSSEGAGSRRRAPGRCILDLDLKEAPFRHVVTVARAIARCAKRAPAIKSSGSTGLHVLLPWAVHV